MDLTTRYMGLHLKNPLVASASPLTRELDGLRLLEDAGAAALVLPSLFQEEIEAEVARYDRLTSANEDSWPEATSQFPALVEAKHGPHHYLCLIRRASEAVDVPVIASLNGVTNEGWISYAKLIEEAGAKGLELNIYFIPADLTQTGREVEQRYIDILAAVRATVSIPIAVKLSPYFSSIGNMALALQDAGADALVLFNRFYQPDLDLTRLQVMTDLRLSEPSEIRLPLLWLAVLAGRVKLSLAASTGVASSNEVIKYLLAGADVVMATSALLRHGPGHMATLLAGLEKWLASREFNSLDHVRGLMSQRKLKDPQALERANYIEILEGYSQH
ncbi:dihydroorotate dehydrogenase-like protein [Methylocella tundrae]|uniref:Dihydroorotate dehydrogenase (Fumarate) n=1 Tax=Methylocella tundrae TaxID=227605 RepID=A0A4U8Z6S2_METTU|nr:dihydroorotate dehydrogenase-like protein [Methylocella tundrae]WPP04551.1 dihydroorotate dehydrogenase-like protein [Methylocella tundrae]VFU10965.1 Dihydroorotate dehydrogenase (Fumarate) [Methylocella tundrae]